jgi:hypothetical protein
MARTSSRREKRRKAVEHMRAAGQSWADIARQIAREEHVSMRVAFRLARDLTQWEVADAWNRMFPEGGDGHLMTAQVISYWETWPRSGRQPTVRTYVRLARIYQCGVGDLIDHGDYSDLDPVAGRPGSEQPAGAGPGGPPGAAPAATPECVPGPVSGEDPQACLVTCAMQVMAGVLERMALSVIATAEMLRSAYSPEDLTSPPARNDPVTPGEPESSAGRGSRLTQAGFPEAS